MSKFSLIAVSMVLAATAANAGTILINFETVPVEATGPSDFADAGPAQVVVVPGVATFTGGVILGNESALPADSFGTLPNVYATAGFGDPSLSSTLTLTINPSFGTVTEVSFPVFNGDTASESYIATAFDGSTAVGSQTLSDLAPNSSGGFGIINLMAPAITSVTIAPTALDTGGCCDGWDYSIDSIALNETVQQASNAVPEPGNLVYLLALGLPICVFLKSRQKSLQKPS
jgi:hypothetical protein